MMLVGTAGTTAGGAIDPLPELAALARHEGLWFHVDAAWGGSALVSPSLGVHLRGIELADSVTWDAHKWLSAGRVWISEVRLTGKAPALGACITSYRSNEADVDVLIEELQRAVTPEAIAAPARSSR